MTANEYERLIRQYDYKKLIKLWENVKKRKAIKGWSMGKAFEYLILRGFELGGGETRYSYSVTMGEVVYS